MPRFTMRDLLLATTLIAVGIAGWCATLNLDLARYDALVVAALAISAGMIGGGLGTPFQRKVWGAILFSVAFLLVDPFHTAWGGSFHLSVRVVSNPKPIRSVSCLADFSREGPDLVTA